MLFRWAAGVRKSNMVRMILTILPALAILALAFPAGAQSRQQQKKFQPFLTRGETTWSLSTGVRKSSFDWDLASDTTGTATPNIDHEQSWSDNWTAEIKGKVRHVEPADIFFIKGGVQLEAEASAGYTLNGRSSLSSYAGDDRTLEYLRQTFKKNSGEAIGGAVSVGYKINLTGTPGRNARALLRSPSPKSSAGKMMKQRRFQHELEHAGPYISVTPLIGYGVDQQTYHREDAYQHLPDANPDAPDVGPFHTESDFIANWYGPFIGLETEIKDRKNMLRLRGEYHDLSYYAKGVEASRAADLKQDPTYDQEADGKGLLLNAEYAYALADDYALTLDATWRRRKTDAGTYTQYPLDGNDYKTRLNGAEDSTAGMRIGVRYNWD